MTDSQDTTDLWLLPADELERRVALLYEAGLIELQKRMHPEVARAPVHSERIHIAGASPNPPTPGAGESPEELGRHGRQIFESIIEPVLPEICESYANKSDDFRDYHRGVREITRHLTRVNPPDDLFVTVATLLWKEGLDRHCRDRTKSP